MRGTGTTAVEAAPLCSGSTERIPLPPFVFLFLSFVSLIYYIHINMCHSLHSVYPTLSRLALNCAGVPVRRQDDARKLFLFDEEDLEVSLQIAKEGTIATFYKYGLVQNRSLR